MARKRSRSEPLDTIWEVSDDLWARIEPILKEDWSGKEDVARFASAK